MPTNTYQVKGMHCASCSAMIEKTFKKVGGVNSAEVNYGTETAKISFDPQKTSPQAVSRQIEPLGYSLVMPTAADMSMSDEEHAGHLGLKQSKKEKLAEIAAMRTKIISAIPLPLVCLFIMAWDILAQFKTVNPPTAILEEFFHYLLPIMATYMLLVVGQPYLLGFYRFLRYGKANMDTLIGLGTATAYLYSFSLSAFAEPLRPYVNVDQTYFDVTIIVIAFITLGKYLEARAKIKTGNAIEKLLNLQTKTALVIRDGQELEIPINQVSHGDIIVIKPGARLPVDGLVADGSSFVDESMVTGEPMPIEKNAGDAVVAGTINTTGSFTFTATKVGAETLLAHIINMVEAAQGSRAPIQALADKISAVFVPIVLALAVLALAIWLLSAPTLGLAIALSYGLTSFVGILVIACPCALGLATPTAIIVGVGKGAREGILIKDAATLEKLHEATVVVVDKTGTITKGKPEIAAIRPSEGHSEREIISALAPLESRSEHPIADAIVSHAKENGIDTVPVGQFEMLRGRGVRGVINGTEYSAGNAKFMEDLRLPFDVASI